MERLAEIILAQARTRSKWEAHDSQGIKGRHLSLQGMILTTISMKRRQQRSEVAVSLTKTNLVAMVVTIRLFERSLQERNTALTDKNNTNLLLLPIGNQWTAKFTWSHNLRRNLSIEEQLKQLEKQEDWSRVLRRSHGKSDEMRDYQNLVATLAEWENRRLPANRRDKVSSLEIR